jgi:hypothetical protein
MSPALTLTSLLAPPGPVHRPWSRTLADLIAHKRPVGLEHAMQAYTKVIDEGAEYVEGLVVCHDPVTVILEHAWVALPDGTILDTDSAYCATDAPAYTYFPMFTWSTLDLIRGYILGNVALAVRGRPRREFWGATVRAWQYAAALGGAQSVDTVRLRGEAPFRKASLGRRWRQDIRAGQRSAEAKDTQRRHR